MKNIIRHFALLIIACIHLISCKNDSLNPAQTSTIPSRITVKEKSMNGNFDSVVADYSLTFSSDTSFVNSVYDNLNGAEIFINHSRFAQEKMIYFSKDNELRDIDGDSVATTVLFDDDNRINWIYEQYAVNNKYPFQVSGEINFNYDSQNRLQALNSYGYRNNSGGCNVTLLGSTGSFYSAAGKDSLVLTIEGPSCGVCPYCVDSAIVTYLNTPNNTHLAILSFPSLAAAYFLSSNDYMFLMQYLPFPKLNGKLMDKIYYSNGTLRYANSYTFDAEGRVKTAKIASHYLYNTLKEKLIEFNY